MRALVRRPLAWLGGGAALLVLLVLVQQALATTEATWVGAGRRADPTLAPLQQVERVGALEERALREASGLTPSARVPAVFWSHNDSGHAAELFALDATGRALGRVTVTGASNRDWEAIARGPCDDTVCLYIGDVGDNGARRTTVTLWRVPEPEVPGRGRVGSSAPADSLRVQYPDGPRDVEALWVDEVGDTWLVTKRRLRGPGGTRPRARVYRVPATAWRAAQPAVARLVDSLPHVSTRAERTMITDAAYRPPVRDSLPARLAVRTYRWVYVFTTAPGGGRPAELVATCDLGPLRERQGEAVAWRADGRLLFGSEGRESALFAGRCP